MKLTFLGTGTSCGVPVIGCQCKVCQSADAKDKRTRCSALVETESTRILIDCGPDFRQQILPQPFRKIDGILITHSHYDHMGGMDDIRPYCQFGAINVYADTIAKQSMLQMLPYCFAENRYPGVPAIGLHEIHPHQPLQIGDLEVMPIQVMHGKLPILGYRHRTAGGKCAEIRQTSPLAPVDGRCDSLCPQGGCQEYSYYPRMPRCRPARGGKSYTSRGYPAGLRWTGNISIICKTHGHYP